MCCVPRSCLMKDGVVKYHKILYNFLCENSKNSIFNVFLSGFCCRGEFQGNQDGCE